MDYDFKDEESCIMKKNYFNQLLIMYYFIVTTLSTVGLGDYRPISNFERIEIIPYFLFGYLVFSYINGEILALSFVIRDRISNTNDINGLTFFIKTLKRKFNGAKTLSKDIELRLFEFFEFYWDNHNTSFLDDTQGEELFDKLPTNVKLLILRDFCYPEFVTKFKRLFQFKTYFDESCGGTKRKSKVNLEDIQLQMEIFNNTQARIRPSLLSKN